MNCIRLSVVLALLSFSFVTSLSLGSAKERAREVFGLCASCHGNLGEGNPSVGAPAIAGMPQWYVEGQLQKFRDGSRGKHPRDLAGMRMGPMARSITADDVKLISEYVAQLSRPTLVRTVSGNAEAGKGRFAACLACHGANGEGNVALKAPPLTGTNDWYLVAQLKNFKDGVRGGNAAQDATAAGMRAMALPLDDAAMTDLVSYVQTLR